MNNSTMIESCLNKENFEKVFHYIQWKHSTSKKLSPNRRVFFGKGYEVEALEDGEEGQRILLYKGNSLLLAIPSQGAFNPLVLEKKNGQYEQLFCDLLEVAKSRSLPQEYYYQYADGNQNVWKIGFEKIVYDPVQPAESSSGLYSGGDPFEKNMKPEQFYEIEGLLKKALLSKEGHAKDRMKGTGLVIQSVTEHVMVSSAILKMDSKEKWAIESWLEEIKK